MNILIVSATEFEIEDLIAFLHQNYTSVNQNEFEIGHHKIKILITGVGIMQTAFALGQLSMHNPFDLAVNLGICGCFDFNIPLGTIVEVKSDRLGDFGVEEADGSFLDIYDMNLENGLSFPYHEGWLRNSAANDISIGLHQVVGITVNKVTGKLDSISAISEKYHADVESMEGAAFFYACAKLNIPSIQIRAISNYVEPRNKANWKMADAIKNLNQFAIKYLTQL